MQPGGGKKCGFWICFRDQATSISDRCGARQGAGKDGLRGFGLAAGKKKLSSTELGERGKWNRYLARAVGVEMEQVLDMLHVRWLLYAHEEMLAIRRINLESRGEVQAGGIHRGVVSV